MGMGGALQQGYNPQGMYNVVYNPETASFENIGFTPSDRPAIQSTLGEGNYGDDMISRYSGLSEYLSTVQPKQFGQSQTDGIVKGAFPRPMQLSPRYSPPMGGMAGGPSKGAPQQGYNPYGMYDNQGGFTPSGQPSGFGRSPYSVQNIIQRDMMTSGYGMNPYSYRQPMGMQGKGGLSMGMTPNYATTSYMNPYSSPYSRPYFPQTTGSFFRNNAPAFGFYGQPETFGMPGPGYPDPFNVNPYSAYNVMGGPSKGAPQQGYGGIGMYNPSFRPPPQMGGKGGAGGGKGGGQIQQGYDPYAMYDPTLKSKAQAFADAARQKEFDKYFQEQARLEAERLAAGGKGSEGGDKPLRPRR
tara:strand:+ start:898 stop:1962 length:1065 start_codon:yes stop_codon:yes gene_type:complete